ncbi:MAG: hypothetical protein Q8P25_01730 [Candidatus Curtissbacteria bacterium]|nr:hypothetical protein [Candidatus Curtissbacteria bacterium]
MEDAPEEKPAESESPVEKTESSQKTKNPLAAGGVVIVLIVVVALFAILKKSPQSPQTPVVSQEATTSTQAKGSIKSLLTAGKSVSCTINNSSDVSVSEGKIYVSGNKMYGEFKVLGADAKEIQSYMIQDGENGYFWTGTTGTKIKIDPTAASPTAQSDQSVDLNQDVDMDCSSWPVDNSKFVPPANVQFTDVSEVLKQTTQGTKANCDQITDPQAKAACLQYSGQ